MCQLHPVEQALLARWPLEHWSQCPSVLAVSGGCDSVALLLAAVTVAEKLAPQLLARRRLHVAHFNHRWREEAPQDAHFVQELCRRFRLPFHLGQAPEAARSEAAARDQRYAFLRQVAAQVGARFVATAHTANDQAETVLHNLLRGTGLAGLGGIRPCRPLNPLTVLVRPLLDCWRKELEEYLRACGQPWREDASNRLLRFRRNRLRRVVLPRLERLYGPGVQQRLVRLAESARELYELLNRQAQKLLEAALCPAPQPGTVCLDAGVLQQEPELLVREALVELWRRRGWPQGEMTRRHWHHLAQAATAPPEQLQGKPLRFHLPGAVLVERREGRLFLRPGALESSPALSES